MSSKLIYDLWYKDWNEIYEVTEFTDVTFYTAFGWFCGKVAKFGDFNQEDIVCGRCVLMEDGKKLVEGERFALENGVVINVVSIDDLDYITIGLVD